MMRYRMLNFFVHMGIKVTKIHILYRIKQSQWLAKYIDQNTRRGTNAKTYCERDFYELLNNTFLGKTMENARDSTNQDFISHKEFEQRVKKLSKLSFEGILDHYYTFIVYKFDREKQFLKSQFLWGSLC